MMGTAMSKKVLWDKESFANFKVDYDQALLLKQDKFIFHGNWYLVGYAKYLIEYLTEQFKDNDDDN